LLKEEPKLELERKNFENYIFLEISWGKIFNEKYILKFFFQKYIISKKITKYKFIK